MPPPEEPPRPSRLWIRLYPLDARVPGLARVPRGMRQALRRAAQTRQVRRHTETLTDVRIVAVTGSLGKTTTKDLVAEMLAAAGPTLKTRGTSNGLDAVPGTLLGISPRHRFAAIELGIHDEPGEMAWMASLFRPAVAVLTAIGEDHTREYGSREAVAREKRALLERLDADGVAVVNADDELARQATQGLSCRVVLAGAAPDADVRLLDARLAWPDGLDVSLSVHGERAEVRVPLLGRHWAPIVALAVAAAHAAGVPVQVAARAAATVAPAPGRMNVVPGPNGSTLLLDDYKSWMAGARAALATLAEAPAERRVAVLGELSGREPTTEQYGELAADLRTVDRVIAVGRSGPAIRELAGERVTAVPRVEDAAALLRAEARPGDVVLVNGSRPQHMQRIGLLLGRAPVGCTVRRCVFHWLCTECVYLRTRPPDSCVEAA